MLWQSNTQSSDEAQRFQAVSNLVTTMSFSRGRGRRRDVSGRRSSRKNMPKQESYRNQVDLLQGTLDMLILRTLQWGSQHGHGIGQAIRATSADVLQVEHGSLYPALHRMERQ